MLNMMKVNEMIAKLQEQKLSAEIEWTEVDEYGFQGDVTEGLRTETQYKMVGGTKFVKIYMNVNDVWVPVIVLPVPQQGGLKGIREERGLSQSQLAEKSGVSARMIQYYEQGVKDIAKAQAQTVLSLAKALECTAEDLIAVQK